MERVSQQLLSLQKHSFRWVRSLQQNTRFLRDSFRRAARRILAAAPAAVPICRPMSMLDLTPDERAAIKTAALPIPRDRKATFKQAVIAALADLPTRGPGIVHRIIVEAQRRYIDPPRVA
jgi:hypothetical protein